MRLKEKLAEEFWLANREVIFSLTEAYIAGFEKARAIAAEMVEPYDCDIQEEMKDMGEEDVE